MNHLLSCLNPSVHSSALKNKKNKKRRVTSRTLPFLPSRPVTQSAARALRLLHWRFCARGEKLVLDVCVFFNKRRLWKHVIFPPLTPTWTNTLSRYVFSWDLDLFGKVQEKWFFFSFFFPPLLLLFFSVLWSDLVARMSRDPDDVNKLTESTYKVNIRGTCQKEHERGIRRSFPFGEFGKSF